MFTNEFPAEQPALFPQQHVEARLVPPLVGDVVNELASTLSLVETVWTALTGDDKAVCLTAVERLLTECTACRIRLIGQ